MQVLRSIPSKYIESAANARSGHSEQCGPWRLGFRVKSLRRYLPSLKKGGQTEMTKEIPKGSGFMKGVLRDCDMRANLIRLWS